MRPNGLVSLVMEFNFQVLLGLFKGRLNGFHRALEANSVNLKGE